MSTTKDELAKIRVYLDRRLKEMDVRVAGLDDDFANLFAYMEKRYAEMGIDVSKKASREQYEHTVSALDSVMKAWEIDEQERSAIIHQLNQQETRLTSLESQTIS